MISFWILLLFIPTATCENITTFPYFYPFNTSIGQPYNEPLGTKIWTFNVPYKMFATVTINAMFTDSDYFAIYNTANFIRAYNSPQPLIDGIIPQNASSVIYYFPGNFTTTIEMKTSSANSLRLLSFSIKLENFVDAWTTQKFVNSSAIGDFLLFDKGYTRVYSPAVPGQTIMLSLATRTLNKDFGGSTDSCFVYRGSSCINGTFISGIMPLSVAYMETNEDVAFCCVDYDLPIYILIAVAKPGFMGPNDTWISRIAEANRLVNLNNIELTGAIGGTQYLTTVDTAGVAEYLETVVASSKGLNPTLINDTSVGIYAGAPSNTGFVKLTEYLLVDQTTWLPQEVCGYFRTYVVKKGDVQLFFPLWVESAWFYPSRSREGFAMTIHYPSVNGYQNSYTFFKTNTTTSTLIIDFNKTVVDMGPGGSFVVSPSHGDTDDAHFTLTPNVTELQLTATTFTFQGNTGDKPAKGAIVYFNLIYGSASAFYTTLATIFLTWLHLI